MLLYADCQFCFIPLYVSTHLRFCGLLCFYTTGRFYASTMLLYANYQFYFTPLYFSRYLRFHGSLCFYMTGRFYASTMLLYADCQFCLIPLCVSTRLRCYCTPTDSFVLHHYTFLPINVSTAHFTSEQHTNQEPRVKPTQRNQIELRNRFTCV